jgi:Polyphosphate kinase 2 (PPK2)
MKAYERCITATTTDECPWYIVPADDKANARLIIAGVLVDLLDSLNLHYPEPDGQRKEQLKAIRKLLESEKS